jgi:copper chaperone NosL
MKPFRFLVLISALMLAACDESPSVPAAQEPSRDAVAEFCGMSLQEHSGPKAQLFVRDRAEPYWFASVHDMFAFTFIPENQHPIVGIYVTDMGRVRNWDRPEPGTWIDAHKAAFVIESNYRSGMNETEAVPFGAEPDAQAFIAHNGGRMVQFGNMPMSYILPGQSSDVSSSRDRTGGQND